MSDQSWSVTITSTGFAVDAYGQSGSQLTAGSGDIVSWNNQTAEVHQPYQTDKDYNPITNGSLCNPIPAWKSSSPGYVLPTPKKPPETIYYYCQEHPKNTAERGTIVLTS